MKAQLPVLLGEKEQQVWVCIMSDAQVSVHMFGIYSAYDENQKDLYFGYVYSQEE